MIGSRPKREKASEPVASERSARIRGQPLLASSFFAAGSARTEFCAGGAAQPIRA